jgi:hypothetical protein
VIEYAHSTSRQEGSNRPGEQVAIVLVGARGLSSDMTAEPSDLRQLNLFVVSSGKSAVPILL